MAVSSISGIGQDQFLQLLVAQLQNQDPLSPTTDREFIAQLASLNTVQGIQTLNANFAEMLKLQQLTEGTNLIGKTVDYTPTGGGANASGKVDSVAVQDGQFVLQIGDNRIGLDQIVSVRA
jgi:flagellar basal-body rod modification protein FlgD